MPTSLPLDFLMDLPRPVTLEHLVLGDASVLVKTATLRLVNAIMDQDADAVGIAIEKGARVNVAFAEQGWPESFSMARTPLGLALWLAIKDDSPQKRYGGIPSSVSGQGDALPDFFSSFPHECVDRLLNAGARPHAGLARAFDDRNNEACSALQQAVLQAMSEGVLERDALMTFDDRSLLGDRHVESVVPLEDGVGKANLWLHVAVRNMDIPAVKGWFADGGVVGTGSHEDASALEMAWQHHFESEAPIDTMLNVLRPHLLAEPSPSVYRKEVMTTLASYAKNTRWFAPDHPRLEACLAWLENLTRERSLGMYQRLLFEKIGLNLNDVYVPLLEASLNRLEKSHLNDVANQGIPAGVHPTPPARVRL